MAGSNTLIALDQGTTSSRAMVFDVAGTPLATAQQEFPQICPAEGCCHVCTAPFLQA